MTDRHPESGLYVHLPFCAQRCGYCTFASTTELSRLPATVAALCRELEGLGRRRRWANLSELDAYVAAVAAGRSPREQSWRLSPEEELKERVMLGLRVARGVDERIIAKCCEVAPGFSDRLDDFLALSLARRRRSRVRLTPRGWLLSNELLCTLC